MKKPATPTQQLEDQVRSWVDSSQGRKVIQKTLATSEKTTKKLQENRRLDPVSLDRPFTV